MCSVGNSRGDTTSSLELTGQYQCIDIMTNFLDAIFHFMRNFTIAKILEKQLYMAFDILKVYGAEANEQGFFSKD